MHAEAGLVVPAGIEAVIERLPLALFVLDRNLSVLAANRAAVAVSGLAKKKMLGHGCGQVLGCKHVDKRSSGCGSSGFCRDCAFRRTVESSLLSRTDRNQEEALLETSGQGLRRLRLSTVYYRESDTVLLSVEELSIDQRLESQHEENQKLISALGATVEICHQIAQPLQIVSGYIEMLMFDGGLRDSSFHCLQEIRKQVQRMREISTGLQNIRALQVQNPRGETPRHDHKPEIC